ncbi:GeoRSP system PqqD family peptide chaperone [Malonomonas rubra]|uniref:GeoRSP system PqqD family peptide chaperone n=1 Tax=Malonomonas rubra TaxID=57040 RepID=UPI0026EA2279|nr:GeoRSP system PqqD family peptide chaperone [Malonomonas rubra]
MTFLQRNPDIVWRHEKRREEQVLKEMDAGKDVEERGTVILLISGMMHQLNLLGGMIWNLCDGTRTEEQIVDCLLKEFDVERNVLAADVAEFIEDLLQREWLIYG